MKQFKGTKRPANGFTLMELLVVVSIMVILAGLTMGVMAYVNQKQAMKTAEVQLGLLELALEDYKSDVGEYPENASNDGTGGTSEIQKVLFADPVLANKKVYLTELDPDNDTQGWLSATSGSVDILDPWGTEYRYRTNSSASTRNFVVNPGYDLWSCGPDGESTAPRGQYDPEHEDNLDDIRLW